MIKQLFQNQMIFEEYDSGIINHENKINKLSEIKRALRDSSLGFRYSMKDLF